jgi:hypothetical protein
MKIIPPRKFLLSSIYFRADLAKHDLPIPGSPNNYVSLSPEHKFEIKSNISLLLPLSSFMMPGK